MNSHIEVVEITPTMKQYVVMVALEKLGLAEMDITRDEIVQLILADVRRPNRRFDDSLTAFEYQTFLEHFGIDIDWIRRQRNRLAKEQDSIWTIVDACSKSATVLLSGGLNLNRNKPLPKN